MTPTALPRTVAPRASEPAQESGDAAPFRWTEARVAQLRALWASGRTAAQVAREIGGGLSRSAVTGKVHHLGLSRGAPGRAPASISAVPRLAMRLGEVSLALKVRSRRGPALAPQAFEPVHDAPRPAPARELPPPASRPCSLLELSRDTCRWPIGEPGAPGFHFCGAPPDTGRLYCAHHRHIAKAPPGAHEFETL